MKSKAKQRGSDEASVSVSEVDCTPSGGRRRRYGSQGAVRGEENQTVRWNNDDDAQLQVAGCRIRSRVDQGSSSVSVRRTAYGGLLRSQLAATHGHARREGVGAREQSRELQGAAESCRDLENGWWDCQ
jgi:hypothetical protein